MLTDGQIEVICAASRPRVDALLAELKQLGSALVAFSGGVDSALVAKLAHDTLGDRAVAMTAVGPAVPEEEAEAARDFTRALGMQHLFIESHELADERYAQNPTDRCYFCKTELYSITGREAAKHGLAAVLDGFNADDFKDHRPGHRAAKEREVRSPLASAQLTKTEVRAWSKRLGLSTWDKPQLACLASRLPYGTKVTAQRLNQVGRAEQALKRLGLKIFRVRYHGEVARLEVDAPELPRLSEPEFRKAVDSAVKAAGFTFVAIDLEPFRSGRLNDALRKGGGLALPVLSSASVSS
jgi:pyridinium-3,5-biscarboxylic acid mononucleotide sulfurtransferase